MGARKSLFIISLFSYQILSHLSFVYLFHIVVAVVVVVVAVVDITVTLTSHGSS